MIENSSILTGIFENISISSLYYSFGSTVALILGFMQIYTFTQDRIKLGIDLNVISITVYPPRQIEYGSIEERGCTKISIDADIKNEGRQPVTIAKIELVASNNEYNLKLFNGNNTYFAGSYHSSFDPIRIDSNDRRIINIFNSEMPYIENIKSIEWAVLFYTSHKIIKKGIELNV
jgi:hypothetical protein